MAFHNSLTLGDFRKRQKGSTLPESMKLMEHLGEKNKKTPSGVAKQKVFVAILVMNYQLKQSRGKNVCAA